MRASPSPIEIALASRENRDRDGLIGARRPIFEISQ